MFRFHYEFSNCGEISCDAETSMGITRRDVLDREMAGFSDLIRLINLYGK